MKYSLFYILIIIWLLNSCSGNIVNIPLTCNCPNIAAVGIDSLASDSVKITWKSLWNVYEYEIHVTNIENNEDSVITVIDTSEIYPNTLSKNINGLFSGSLYDIKVRAVCQRPYHCKYGEWSSTIFFVTDNIGNCGQPVNFSIFEVKQDTLTLAWQNVSGISDYLISITDSMGNLVLHQNYTDVSPTTSPMRYGLLATSLPDGDYTIWIQSDCGSELSLPSNMGVFTLRHSGGGPVVVIDDNIDIYAPTNCPTCAVNFPITSPNVDVISPRSMTFANRNTPPQQILMGYTIDNNSNIACAPTTANTWRIKSFPVHAPYFNMPSSDYRVSLPAIKCICAGENYGIRVIARDNYVPFSGGLIQTCN